MLAIGVLVGIVSAFVLAVAAGIFIALLGESFLDSGGEPIFLFDLIFFPLFVLPPYLITGFVASFKSRHLAIKQSFLAGTAYLAIYLISLILLNDEPVQSSDYLHALPIVPLALLGGWLAKKSN